MKHFFPFKCMEYKILLCLQFEQIIYFQNQVDSMDQTSTITERQTGSSEKLQFFSVQFQLFHG